MNWEAVAKEAMENGHIPVAFDELSLEDQDSVVGRVHSSVASSRAFVEGKKSRTDE